MLVDYKELGNGYITYLRCQNSNDVIAISRQHVFEKMAIYKVTTIQKSGEIKEIITDTFPTYSAQILENGNLLISQRERIIEVNPKRHRYGDKIVMESWIRNPYFINPSEAVVTDNGTILISGYTGVIEIDTSGNEIWSYSVAYYDTTQETKLRWLLVRATSARRLENGNTLISEQLEEYSNFCFSTVNGKERLRTPDLSPWNLYRRLIEIDEKGKFVKEILIPEFIMEKGLEIYSISEIEPEVKEIYRILSKTGIDKRFEYIDCKYNKNILVEKGSKVTIIDNNGDILWSMDFYEPQSNFLRFFVSLWRHSLFLFRLNSLSRSTFPSFIQAVDIR